MPFISKSKTLHWTYHARDKMRFYKLSEARVRRVINSPKRIEEGVAPKTVAMMQPTSVKSDRRQVTRVETWNQEIWVMIEKWRQGIGDKRQEVTKVISAWRYPGVTKSKSAATVDILRQEYKSYLGK